MRGLVPLHLLRVGLHLDDMAKHGIVFVVVWSGGVCARREWCGASEVALRLSAWNYKANEKAIAVYKQLGEFKQRRGCTQQYSG